jgi:hypothetical protein
MIKTILFATFTMGLVGCGGLSEDDFIDGYLAETCRLSTECAEEDDFSMFESTDDCITFMKLFGGSSIGNGCEYSAKDAKTCMTYLEGLTCETASELLTGDSMPAECTGAYTGECSFTGEGQQADTGGEDTDTEDTDE